MAMKRARGHLLLELLCHLAIASYYVALRVYNNHRLDVLLSEKNTTLPGYETMGGRYKFLTQINLIVQVVFFVYAALVDGADVFQRYAYRVTYLRTFVDVSRHVRDVLFGALVFPIAMFIVCVFWPLYFYDRELIFPSVLDEFIPFWINVYEHLGIGVLVLVEMILVYHCYPSKQIAFIIITTFGAAYMGLVFYIAYVANFWLYPVMAVLAPAYRVLFFCIMFGFVFVIFYAGEKLNALVWGDAGDRQEKLSLRRKKVR